MSSCCPPKKTDHHHDGDACHSHGGGVDWLFWVSGILVIAGFIIHNAGLHGLIPEASLQYISVFSSTVDEFVRLVWWGILMGIFFVGLMNFVPREMAVKVVGRPGTRGGVLRAAMAGILFDLCSHGILLVGLKLYERGASLGQVMAFLIASPWNSISLTIILFALIGVKWTLLFIVVSFFIALFSGLIFDWLVTRGTLPQNNKQYDGEEFESFKQLWNRIEWTRSRAAQCFKDAIGESKMIIRWMFVGIILIGLLRTFMDEHMFMTLFAPTLAGLGLTLIAATIIEVCSEGLAPIAADLLNRASAPGNAFTFLMAGVSTDYTEIMGLKEATRSWKIALFLPLVTVPQIMLISLLMNS